MKALLKIIDDNLSGQPKGVYSVCSANEFVLAAAVHQAIQDGSIVLIEATANQVNQFGGYTGMTPEGFYTYVQEIVKKSGLPIDRLILGGDHLGPVCWAHLESDVAMENAKDLVVAYVKAGFKKIHLDTSMACADDPNALADTVIAERAAILAASAEKAAIETFGESDLVYVIGTEVPPPGGARSNHLDQLQLSKVEDVVRTVDLHKQSFEEFGVESAFQRVIAVVVQPGVEFSNESVFDYTSNKAKNLSEVVSNYKQFIFEAHSTDYQKPQAYRELVKDHFAILKVGPQLTFAMREALFALSYIEDFIIPEVSRSNFRELCDTEMLANQDYWKKFYTEKGIEGKLLRFYSFSDRIRYYWNTKTLNDAIKTLIDNLSGTVIPLPLLSQFLPEEYRAVRMGSISSDPRQLIKHKILQVLKDYSSACYFSGGDLMESY